MADEFKRGQSSGIDPHVASLLCYVCGFIPGVIFLLIEKENKEVNFNAWQSIAYEVTGILVYLICHVFSMVPFFGFLISALGLLGYYIVLRIVLMIKAYQGEHFKLPVLGDFAEAQSNK